MRVFYYVRHHDIPQWEALGWADTKSLEGTHHGYWSTVMEWKRPGEPVMPWQAEGAKAVNEILNGGGT